jgi:hypothetical protein
MGASIYGTLTNWSVSLLQIGLKQNNVTHLDNALAKC